MKNLTLSLGILMIILGLASYLGTGQTSITALIPSFFGILFIILAFLSDNENLHKMALNTAVALAILGTAGGATGLMGIFDLIQGNEVERPVAVYGQTAMFFMCLVYVIRARLSRIESQQNENA